LNASLRWHHAAGIAASWAYLFVMRGDAPLVIGGRAISDREKLLGASSISVAVIFFLTSVGSVLFSAVCIGLAGAWLRAWPAAAVRWLTRVRAQAWRRTAQCASRTTSSSTPWTCAPRRSVCRIACAW
jgi:hypothetical protein